MVVYVLGLVAALLLALGFVIQQHVATEAPAQDRLTPRLLIDLIRRPAWLAGIAMMVGGQIVGAVDEGKGSLTVVEPVLATNVLFALPLAAAWTRRRLGLREYGGAVALVAGLGGFVAAAGPTRVTTAGVARTSWVIAGLAIVAVVAALVFVAKRATVAEEATLVATGAGILYGLQDALTQRVMLLLPHGLGDLLSSWQPYSMLAVAITGLILAQSAFGAAPLPASLPAITIAEPICGIALGAGLLAEPIRVGPGYLAAEVVCVALMVAGVVLVTRSPVVTGTTS